jgi:hypothetical protein
MYRQRLETLRETIQRLARRLAVAVRVIPPARLTVIGAAGGTITVTAEGRTLSVRHPERVTITLPRGASVHVRAAPDPRYRLVALRIDNVEITEPEHEFIIISDTTVTAVFEHRFWRVMVMWELVVPEQHRGRRSPRVAAEARIYTYTIAASEDEAERALEDADELFQELRDPAACDPPDSALTSFEAAEESRHAYVDRVPSYGVEVSEVDADEVEELDTILAYAAIYRRAALWHSYKWRRDEERRVWRLIERDGRPA